MAINVGPRNARRVRSRQSEENSRPPVHDLTVDLACPLCISVKLQSFLDSSDDGEMVTPVPRGCCGGFCETPILARSRFFGAELCSGAETVDDRDTHTYKRIKVQHAWRK